MNIRAQVLRATAKYAAGHVLPRPLCWQDSLTSWSAFLPGSPTLPPSTGFFAQHPSLKVHGFFSRCHDSSSWELDFAPADITCWHWKHCLFLSTNCMQNTQSALLSCFPLSAKDCKPGACQENRQRSYLNFIFPERPACQQRTGGQRQPLPPPVCFHLLDFRDGFSLHCLAFPLLCQHLLHPWAKSVLQSL